MRRISGDGNSSLLVLKMKEAETELCWSISCRGVGQQCIAIGAGALGSVDLAMT